VIVTFPPRWKEAELSLPVPVVWSEDCLRHEPAGEVWLGVRDPGTEVPARALAVRDALEAAGAPVVATREHDDARADRASARFVPSPDD
jgi:hypothetical protein